MEPPTIVTLSAKVEAFTSTAPAPSAVRPMVILLNPSFRPAMSVASRLRVPVAAAPIPMSPPALRG